MIGGLKLFDYGTELNRSKNNSAGAGMKIDFSCEICGKHRSVGNHKRCSKQKQIKGFD